MIGECHYQTQIFLRLNFIEQNNEKKNFTDRWKELTEITEDAKICIDDLFRYYTHIIRAKSDDKSKEIGLRKFYATDKYARLKETNLMDNLFNLSEFWFAVDTGETTINDVEKINVEAKKYIHCLQCYPNEYWKYITGVFFYKNKESDDFIDTFPNFLKKLTAFLFVKFIEKPTVNAIKDDIYQCGIDVFLNNPLNFRITQYCPVRFLRKHNLFSVFLDCLCLESESQSCKLHF